mgnify:CR=1 FL=1
MSTNDGGPAFPVSLPGWGDNGASGMALRDYFAAKAPPPPAWWMDSYAKNAKDLDTVADVIAQWNYVYADAMLKARRA